MKHSVYVKIRVDNRIEDVFLAVESLDFQHIINVLRFQFNQFELLGVTPA